MSSLVLRVAAEVVSRSSREKPADAVLRETFRVERGLSASQTREISRAVFAYHRWFGWLDRKLSVAARVERALEQDERFRKNPFSLPVANLRTKAVPAWVSDEVHVADEWLRSLQREPKLWLRARRERGEALAKSLRLARASASPGLQDAVLYEGREDLFRTAEFKAGEFEIQDISSQAVGLICDPKPGQTWWDGCAGEGGKMLHLSDLMQNKGLIWASDRVGWRLAKLKRRAARAKVFNYRCALWDGGAKLPTKTKFDGVLVDAPCSGVGTWQRHPHARWTTTLGDVKELSSIQRQLLAHVALAVKPGGKLVYAVCTLTRSETIEVADDFENRFKEFKPLPVANPLLPEQPAAARIWIWPQRSGGNGMFVGVWTRCGQPATAAPCSRCGRVSDLSSAT